MNQFNVVQSDSTEKKITIIPRGDSVRIFASNLEIAEKIEMLTKALEHFKKKESII